MNGNAVHFDMIVDFDDETAFAVDLQGVDQIRTSRIHLYDNIGVFTSKVRTFATLFTKREVSSPAAAS